MEQKQKAVTLEFKNKHYLNSEVPLWFAVYTKYRSEKFVCQQLLKKGIQAYVPLQNRVRKYKRKVKSYEIPVINCYVFVKIKSQEYIRVLDTPYVNFFIKTGRDIRAIEQEEIDILRKIAGSDVEVKVRPIQLKPGMEVMINSGNLTGLKGVITARSGKKEFCIQLENLGLEFQLQVSEDILSSCSKDKALA